jgi:hypothetical protein
MTKIMHAVANYGSVVANRNLDNPLGRFLHKRVAKLYETLDEIDNRSKS